MDLQVPWARLLLLCAAVVLAGTLTAWLAGRAAAGRDAVLAVKEDWYIWAAARQSLTGHSPKSRSSRRWHRCPASSVLTAAKGRARRWRN